MAVLTLLCPVAARAQEQPRTITLSEAVQRAVLNDPAAVAAEVGIANARSAVLQSRGSWLPSLTLNSTYSNSSNQRFDQTTGQLVSTNYTAQVQGSYELFGGGRRFMVGRAAGAELDAADAQYRAQHFTTVLRTTEIYYAAAAGAGLVEAARQRLQRAQQQMAAANTRLELGTATQSDALRAELEVGNAELALLDAERDLRNAALQLGRQVGEPGEVHAEPAALPASAPQLPSLAVLTQQAERSAPAVQAANATLRSSRADRMAAYTPYVPSVRLTGGYDWSAFTFPPREQSWSLRVIASLPVFNGFQRESALQRAAAAERLALARARDARLAANVQVASAVAEIASAERRVALSDRATQLALEDLRVQEERYGLGVATILDLQTSQVALSDAEVAAVRARQALGTAIARLESILGQQLGQE